MASNDASHLPINKVSNDMSGTDPNLIQFKRKPKPFAEEVPSAAETLKARKQQLVRDALSEAAMGLFRARGFEAVTVEEIANAAGLSRRTFFRYFASKEDVLVDRLERDGDRILAELGARPLAEPPLLAIRNALIPTIEARLKQDAQLIRDTTRLIRETTALRRAVMERRNRLEERVAALMVQRLATTSDDTTPMLLAFLTRALNDTVFNAWYDNETDDIPQLVDRLLAQLCEMTTAVAPHFVPPTSPSSP